MVRICDGCSNKGKVYSVGEKDYCDSCLLKHSILGLKCFTFEEWFNDVSMPRKYKADKELKKWLSSFWQASRQGLILEYFQWQKDMHEDDIPGYLWGDIKVKAAKIGKGEKI